MASNFAIIDGDLALGYTAQFTRTSGLAKLQQQMSVMIARAINRVRRASQRSVPANAAVTRLKVESAIRDALNELSNAHTRLLELGVDTDPEELLGAVVTLSVRPAGTPNSADPREVFYTVTARSRVGSTVNVANLARV
jgi:hypothetical protein